ncbi:hypothetical protein HMPREF0454_02385 [Hafnia alvei ATCC 51873]|uniref:Uncharacterized protein n=1 Tax=Hafnia alvei ATCC 51873 TaxID=1002364 RepID=G9Y734_HAFAL|nr:hypothetical protein HMPREF0454_02385 [Hafnia alvei ATCC 51873]
MLVFLRLSKIKINYFIFQFICLSKKHRYPPNNLSFCYLPFFIFEIN